MEYERKINMLNNIERFRKDNILTAREQNICSLSNTTGNTIDSEVILGYKITSIFKHKKDLNKDMKFVIKKDKFLSQNLFWQTAFRRKGALNIGQKLHFKFISKFNLNFISVTVPKKQMIEILISIHYLNLRNTCN